MIMKAMLRLSKHREDGRIPTKLYILLDTKKNTYSIEHIWPWTTLIRLLTRENC